MCGLSLYRIKYSLNLFICGESCPNFFDIFKYISKKVITSTPKNIFYIISHDRRNVNSSFRRTTSKSKYNKSKKAVVGIKHLSSLMNLNLSYPIPLSRCTLVFPFGTSVCLRLFTSILYHSFSALSIVFRKFLQQISNTLHPCRIFSRHL
jgi:hypothetical protein